ncbi:ABC transporter ATP-binding protein [Kocuria sp. CPCC 205263]|uniref:ABC transporter ATP-binding protein n=1 Tax=Kocuria sp. CPCC 205263 TaxID=3073555 RepID=UPI0034D4CE55
MGRIEIRGLRHRYDDGRTSLDGIDLAVAEGEFLALIGPSGSGKTTLLRTVAGFLRPENGSIAIDGSEVASSVTWVPAERRGLGMVFQDHAVWPHLSVGDNVGYPLKIQGLPRRERRTRTAEVLELVGLEGCADRSPATLSGGQRQRVSLARAVAAQPEALLLDEALSSLDEPLRARLRVELKALTRTRGLTTVHVTHDRAEALALADRVAVLRDGRIEQVGTPRELLDAPATPFVAGFLTDATLLDGVLEPGPGGPAFRPDNTAPAVAPARVLASPGAPETGRAVAAVLAQDVRVRPAPDGHQGGAGTVTSALFGPHGHDLQIRWHGTDLRAHVAGWVPQIGDPVEVELDRVRVYG